MLILSRTDLERLLTPVATIEAMRTAFAEHAKGQCQVPPRVVLPTGGEGLFLVMPGAVGGTALGAKFVSVHPTNRERGLPTLSAAYLLVDPETGRLLALLDGRFLTGIRTGATSALAATYLARPDSAVVACFGAGTQAGFQLRCLASVLQIQRTLVVGRSREKAERFCEAMSRELGLPVAPASSPREALSRADLVTCATTSPTPVFAGKDLRPGTHVDAVGAFRPDTREVDGETVARARVVVDAYAVAWEEAGDILIPLREGGISRSAVHAELAELVAGTKPGRQEREEITLFKSVGFALEDAAAARLAYDRARASGAGVEVDLG